MKKKKPRKPKKTPQLKGYAVRRLKRSEDRDEEQGFEEQEMVHEKNIRPKKKSFGKRHARLLAQSYCQSIVGEIS